MYYNNGNGTFTDISEKAGVGDKRWGTSCAFLDYDLDGNIDLYVVNYMQYDVDSEKDGLYAVLEHTVVLPTRLILTTL